MANYLDTNLAGVRLNLTESTFYEGYGNFPVLFDGKTEVNASSNYVLVYTNYYIVFEATVSFAMKYFNANYVYNNIQSAKAESKLIDMSTGQVVITFDKGLGWIESDITLKPGKYKWIGSPYLAPSEVVFSSNFGYLFIEPNKYYSIGENNIVVGELDTINPMPIDGFFKVYNFTNNKSFIDYILSVESIDKYKVIVNGKK